MPIKIFFIFLFIILCSNSVLNFFRPLEEANDGDDGAGPAPKNPHVDEDEVSVADSEEEEWMTELHDCVSSHLSVSEKLCNNTTHAKPHSWIKHN